MEKLNADRNKTLSINGFPITVGIIGHRDAILTTKHMNLVEAIFDCISSYYPNSPIVLMSQLAEGVDTRIANLFLEMGEKSHRKYSLIAPIPFGLHEYRNRFSKEEKNTFDELLSKSDHHFVINNDVPLSDDELYRSGGKFISDSSIILIAIWDLIDNMKIGGTADIVTYRIQGSFNDDSTSESLFAHKGSLISIPCNRASSNQIKEIKLKDNYLEELLKDDSIKKALLKIEDLNRLKISDRLLNNGQNHLYPGDISWSPRLTNLKHFYSILDSSALDNQKLYKRILKSLLLLALVVITVYQTYTQLGLHQNIFIAIVALIGLTILVFNFSEKWKSHKLYLEDRMLAEALRISFFWRISGLTEPVSKHLSRITEADLKWIKHILNSINGLTYESVGLSLQKINQVKIHWIENQYKYFKNKVKEYKDQKKNFQIISYVFLASAIVLLFVIFIVNQISNEHSWLKALIICDTVIFGLYGVTKGYYEKRGYDQISNHHELMESMYGIANDKIDYIIKSDMPSEINYVKIQEMLTELGKEALSENAYWYTIFKDKEPEVEGFSV